MTHIKPLGLSQRFNEMIHEISEKNIPKPEPFATIDFSNGLNKTDSETIHSDKSRNESEDLINPFDDPVKENLVKTKNEGFKTTFSKIFESVHNYLSPCQMEIWNEFMRTRYGEKHQEMTIYSLLFYKKGFSIRQIAEYLGRSKSSVHRSIQKLKILGFFIYNECKYDRYAGHYNRHKILMGASGLYKYRAEQQKKRQALVEWQSNHISNKLGGTLYPKGNIFNKRTTTNCSQEVDFSDQDHYYDRLLDNVTPLFCLEDKIDMTPDESSKHIRSVFFKKRPFKPKPLLIEYTTGSFGQLIQKTIYPGKGKKPNVRKGEFGQIIDNDCQGYGTFGRMMPANDPPSFSAVRATMPSDEKYAKWSAERYGFVVPFDR